MYLNIMNCTKHQNGSQAQYYEWYGVDFTDKRLRLKWMLSSAVNL